jgi:hypothetical protein
VRRLAVLRNPLLMSWQQYEYQIDAYGPASAPSNAQQVHWYLAVHWRNPAENQRRRGDERGTVRKWKRRKREIIRPDNSILAEAKCPRL